MIKLFDLFKRKAKANPDADVKEPIHAKSVFTTDFVAINQRQRKERANRIIQLLDIPDIHGNVGAMDSARTTDSFGPDYNIKNKYCGTIPENQLYWYASQANIGTYISNILAQHWLVHKVCHVPAKDAIRQGWTVDAEAETLKLIDDIDEEHPLNKELIDFVHMARLEGGRVVYFRFDSTDPGLYSKPFNIDGVTPGSYEGMVQVDIENVRAELTDANLDPTSPRYCKPTFYTIGNIKFHHSHLFIYVPYPVSNRLKPAYKYFGISVPQRVYERVYGSERTANEAPGLAASKRLVSVQVGDAAIENKEELAIQMQSFSDTRDNWGVYVHGAGESIMQHDTSLGDLDAVIMTQYQIVAAAAEMPATKLLGTSPKGFGASGEYEESVYRENLESIQANLTPMMRRHYQIALRSMGVDEYIKVKWNPLDSPTAQEWANIALTKAQTTAIYLDKGVIDGEDALNALRKDENSDYYGIEYADENKDYEEAGEMGERETSPDAGQSAYLSNVSPFKIPAGY